MGLIDWLRQVYHGRSTKNNAEAVLNCIIYGGYIWQNPMHSKSVKAILKKIQKRVYQMESDLERIKFVSTYFSDAKLLNFLEIMDESMTKHEFTATGLKQKSYELFEMFEYRMAIRCCNLSLLFARSDSDIVPSLYADRGMFLYTLNDWMAAIKDVDASLALNPVFTDELMGELVKMKDRCIAFQKEWKPDESDNETDRRSIYCKEHLFKIYGESHPKIPSAGNYISIVQHPVKGRMLVVTQDIGAGTTVIVEDPFVSVMTEANNWELKHCSKCYKETWVLIPCPNCIHTVYCSEECRLAHYESLHKYECRCLNYLHAIYIPWSIQLGFRAVCKTGPESMFKFYKASHIDLKQEICGVNPNTGTYDSDDYLQIYNLISHPSNQYLDLHTWYAVSLAKVLDMKTTFFSQIGDQDKPGFMEFIGSCFLKHSIAFPYNSMTLWEDTKVSKPKKPKRFGSTASKLASLDNHTTVGMNGVFSLCSLICHSCDPSAHRVNLMNGRLAIITNRRLKAGEEITISYGYEYPTDDFEFRSAVLYADFHFKCDCVACVGKWGTEDEIGEKFEHLCRNCSGNYPYEELMLSRKSVLKVVEETETGTCENCNSVFNVSYLRGRVISYEDMLNNALGHVVRDNPIHAIGILIECIEFFQKNVLSPYGPLIRAQAALSCAYDAIAMNSRF